MDVLSEAELESFLSTASPLSYTNSSDPSMRTKLLLESVCESALNFVS